MSPQAVRDSIEQAFGNLPVPQREALLPQPPECDSASQAEIREALAGRTWHSLEREFVEQSWASFVYLAPLGYRYYLPALLIGALDASAEKSTLPHSVYYSLRPSFWSLYYQGADRPFRDRQAIFSTLQYEAVTTFSGARLLPLRSAAYRARRPGASLGLEPG